MNLVGFATIGLTLAVCFTWLALAAGFCGIGVFWLRRLTGLKPSWQNAYLATWAGFGLLMAGLLIWNFFLPVNELALGLFTILAVASLIKEWRWFAATLSTGVEAWFVLTIIAFTIWTANHALAAGGMDDYNYEFQAIRWFHDYRIVPGLANLHDRMGLNSSHHLFGALLSWGPWAGGVNHIFNGLFTVLAVMLLAASVRALASGRGGSSALLGALLVSPCVGLVLFGIFGPMISTLKADVFICAATATLAVLFMEFVETSASDERHLPLGATILLLAPVLFSVKITSVVFCGILALAVLLRLYVTIGWKNRVPVFGALIAALILCSVLMRGVILSGYPLYPSTMVPIDVDWRVPVAHANAVRAFVTSWAQLRPTYAAVAGWEWLPAWARSTALTDKFNIVLPLVLTLCCLPLFLFRRRGERHNVPNWGWATLATGSIASLLVWFVEAPAGRFAFIYFWIVFGLVCTIVVKNRHQARGWALAVASGIPILLAAYLLFFVVGVPSEFRSGMALMLILGFLWFIACIRVGGSNGRRLAVLCLLLGFFQIGDRVLAHIARRRWAEIGPMLWLQVPTLPEHLEKPRYIARQTRRGVVIYEARKVLYDTPLPNTRFFDPAIELRTPGDLSGGFRNSKENDAARYGYPVQVVVVGEPPDQETITADK